MKKYTVGILPTIVVLSVIVCICAVPSSAYVWGGTQNRTESAALETFNKVDKVEVSTSETNELKQSDSAIPGQTSNEVNIEGSITDHCVTAKQNNISFTVRWNDAPAGTETVFHVSQAGGSSVAKARMDVPTYWYTDNSQESICDPTSGQWSNYYELGESGFDFSFEFTASGTYRINFYFMDTEYSVWYLRTTAVVNINDEERPSVTQIVNNAVAQSYAETNGSEYDMALWLHDWAIDRLEYDHSLNWCSAESGLTRGRGTCESYQRIYAKLLNAAGISNGRIEGNGHTWNAVRIDGKWCQIDLTWNDTNDNWYNDLDQRHLYFGLTDELMAMAHSDHESNYTADSYSYRSTDLSNNYFVRNGKAGEWAQAYAERIQRHLDAKETIFFIIADNGSFPPSISAIQNALIAHAINQYEWSNIDGGITLMATSNVIINSNTSWVARYDFEASYPRTTYSVKYYPSETASEPLFEDTAFFATPYSLKGHSELARDDEQAVRFTGWKMRRDSDGKWFAMNAIGTRFVSLADGSLPDGFSFALLKDAGRLLKAASAGSGVSLYAQFENEEEYTIKYFPSEFTIESVAEQTVPYSTTVSIKSLSSLGLLNDSTSFKGWKMRRASDGKWFARNQAGVKRFVGLADGRLPDGYAFYLLQDEANLLRAASVGSTIDLYAVMDPTSYTVEYSSSIDANKPTVTAVVPYAIAYQLESIESLGMSEAGKTFVGWRLHRVVDDKWYAISDRKARYVSLIDGDLPAGYSYRLVRDGGGLSKAAPQGTTLRLIAQWR